MADNNPTADPLMVDLDNVDVHDIDFYSSIQHRLQRVGEEFSTFAQILWGKQVSNFLDSSPGNDQMDNSWRPVRALGQGGFGIVGLWQKTGVGGEIQDEVAIKEIERPPQGDYHLDRDPRLAREAVIMHQLNIAEQRRVHAPKHILRLRSFKHFPSARRWRFFLEYAPHGDLHKLLYAYRAWDTYFPEEFLWHVFHSLAKAATIMEEGPFTHLESGDPIDWSVIHLDLKPENLYLAQPDSVASFPNYPTIKVADFGLSELTGEDDEGNPFLYRLKGTEDYMPPVSISSLWYISPLLLTAATRSRHASQLIGGVVLMASSMTSRKTLHRTLKRSRCACPTLAIGFYPLITSSVLGK